MGKYSIKKGHRQGAYGKRRDNSFISEVLSEYHQIVQKDFLSLMSLCGIKALSEMFEEDVRAICGERYQHDQGRRAYRWSSTGGEISVGGQRMSVKRPRVRNKYNQEMTLPTYEIMRQRDLLEERVLRQIVNGVSSRRYGKTLEVPITGRGTSKSTVSRRWTGKVTEEVSKVMSRRLDELDFTVLLLDGLCFGEYTVVAGVGITSDGHKHFLGVWDGSTENTAVCQSLLNDLVGRGLRTDHRILTIIDGSKALAKAVRQTFGSKACIQRCQAHKIRNVLDHLSERCRWSVEMKMRQAYQSDDYDKAVKMLECLARELDKTSPGAASSLREGMTETLTVVKLKVPDELRRSLKSTNIIESAFSMFREVSHHVKRWQNSRMALIWAGAGLIEAEKRFRRIRGYKSLPVLVAAMENELKRNASTLNNCREAV